MQGTGPGRQVENTWQSFRHYLWEDRYFWIAAMLCLSVQAFEETRWLLWPLKQFGVYVHELFHGLAALVSGGSFSKMILFQDGGGVAYTVTYSPVSRVIVSAGGLIGPALLGGIVLFFSRRFRLTHYLLKALAALLVICTLLWVRDWYTAIFGISIATLLAAVSFLPSKTFLRIFAQYLGIQLSVENLLDFDYMFTERFVRDGQTHLSDTGNIARVLGGSYFFWGCLIAAITLLIILVTLIKSRPQPIHGRAGSNQKT